jgi:hypothetical protein
MKINEIWNRVLHAVDALAGIYPENEELKVETPEGRGSKVEKLPEWEKLNERSDLEYFQKQEDTKEIERLVREKALRLQKLIIKWQKLAGITPEKTLDLLIPIKEGKTERRRSVNFNSTPDMVAYLQDKGFVPYDLDYIEEARTGKYRFIRIKRNEVKNFFEFPDATFNGPEFYTPYRPDYSTPITFGPYLAPHQLTNPVPMTVQEIEAADGKISTLRPQWINLCNWDCVNGIYSEKLPTPFIPEHNMSKLSDWDKFEQELIQNLKSKREK